MMASTWLTVLCFVLTATNNAYSRTLEVTTVLTEPFARYKSLTALPHELEGYILDVLHEMEQDPDMAGIKFTTTPTRDGKYGSLVGGGWNGMIGKLVDGAADLAAAPLTVTHSRQIVVQFLEPAFMTFDLAMLMRTRDVSSDIRSIADLDTDTQFTYAVVAGGSTIDFFRRSRYAMTWSKLEADRDASFVPSVEEGVRRVRESDDERPYIFIGEQHMLEYHASQSPCDLTVVRGQEAEIEGEYRLAVHRSYDPSVVAKLEAALGKLKESGRLDQLYQKWWTERSQCSSTTDN